MPNLKELEDQAHRVQSWWGEHATMPVEVATVLKMIALLRHSGEFIQHLIEFGEIEVASDRDWAKAILTRIEREF